MTVFSVHAAPSEYILKENALDLLEAKLLERNLRKVLVVHGQKSWEAAKAYWPQMIEVQAEEYTYGGDCTLSEIEAVARLVKQHSFEAVIGVGGGKVLDLVKAVCDETERQAILIPTLASNCSPWTPLSVIYDESGAFIRFDIYPVCTSLVLVEPRILAEAPVRMLIAGIGDTLAKWYEADVQMADIDPKPVPLQIAHFAARQCKDLLLQSARGAVAAAKAGEVNDDFIQVAETIMMYGGMVGGYGDHYGRIAGAHSIHNGLTALEETHHALHGDKVAYGILVQLVFEDKWMEIVELQPFYEELGLPLSLIDLGVEDVTEAIMAEIAKKATLAGESIHVMPVGPITAERVAGAIRRLEQFMDCEECG